MSAVNIQKRRYRRDRWKNTFNDVLLWVILFIFFIPALWIILTSIRIRSEINAHPPVWIPTGFSFDSYKILFGMPTPDGAFGLGGAIPVPAYARNSIVIALVSTFFALVFGTLAGYVFSRFNFRAKNSIFLGMMLARAIPGIALSLPLFILFARVGLSDTILGMIITYVALNIPFTAWLMDGFFRAIPEELDEAARGTESELVVPERRHHGFRESRLREGRRRIREAAARVGEAQPTVVGDPELGVVHPIEIKATRQVDREGPQRLLIRVDDRLDVGRKEARRRAAVAVAPRVQPASAVPRCSIQGAGREEC